jgi:drug/metabolite transporter (DMT)-like permease
VTGHQRAAHADVWGPLIALWLIWGSTYLGIALVAKSMPPLTANGLRLAAAGLVLAVLVSATRGPSALRITWAQFRGAATLGAALLGVGIGTLSIAERYVPSGIAALLVAVMPLYVVLFRLRVGDRPARLTLVGVGVGMAGLALMLLPGGTEPVEGDDRTVMLWSAVILCSSFVWALFSWRSRNYTLPAHPMVTTTYELLVGGGILVLAGLVHGERWDFGHATGASWAGWLWLVAASVGGYTAYTWLLANAPLSLTATYAYVNPVVAVLLGFVLLSEPITRDVLLGLTIVVGGVFLVVTGERR